MKRPIHTILMLLISLDGIFGSIIDMYNKYVNRENGDSDIFGSTSITDV